MQSEESIRRQLFQEAKTAAKQLCTPDCRHDCKTCSLRRLTGGAESREEPQELNSDLVFAICSACNNTILRRGRISMTLEITNNARCEACRVYAKYEPFFHTE